MALAISIAAVSERDVDILLLEEFCSTSEFPKWFATKVGFPDARRVIRACCSVNQATGESDIEVTVEHGDSDIVRLLIEDKITAGLQPFQAERYRIRGDSYISTGECTQFRTVLVAPRLYFGRDDNHLGFDTSVTYEDVRDWFHRATYLGLRQAYKLALLSAAIEKGTSGYQLIEDAAVGNFWDMYWQTAITVAAKLEMKRPGPKPARAGFIGFHPEAMQRGVDIVHKLPHGNVDLQFSRMGAKLAELRAKVGSSLDADMAIHAAGKSGCVRIKVGILNPALAFAPQQAVAIDGIKAAQRLLDWYYEHKDLCDFGG